MSDTPIDRAMGAIRAILSSLTDSERADVRRAVAIDGPDDRARIEGALALSRGNMANAAELLGISRRHLQRRMRDVGLPEQRKGPTVRVLDLAASRMVGSSRG